MITFSKNHKTGTDSTKNEVYKKPLWRFDNMINRIMSAHTYMYKLAPKLIRLSKNMDNNVIMTAKILVWSIPRTWGSVLR